MSFSKYFYKITGLLLLTFLLACKTTPTQRPGNSFDGSVHWALNIAQPLITNFAADAQLCSVQGIQIYPDGRLPGNAGTWGLSSWSPSLQKEFQVVVKWDGTTTTNTRDAATCPSANGQPIPAGWVNSTNIFQAIHNNYSGNLGVADLVVFNIATYSSPVWGTHFQNSSEPNHYVSWDGTYLGTQP